MQGNRTILKFYLDAGSAMQAQLLCNMSPCSVAPDASVSSTAALVRANQL
jgi:hypothetical protein